MEEEFDNSVIKAGKYVMLRLPSENFKIEKLKENGTVNLGKFGSFRVNDIVGHPFGFTYEIMGEDKNLRIVESESEMVDDRDELEPHENNRELLDDPSVQKLSTEEIEDLKRKGYSGQEIVDLVIKSHGSFDKKTAFSQEKYLKRKQRKFLQRFTPEPITSTELIDIYLDKDPIKIQDMSVESLGLMMSMADIRPGGTYLVADDVSGVVVAALIERMGGEGCIVCLHESEHPNFDALKYMNCSQELITRMVKTINWLEYLHPEETEPFESKTEDELKELKPSQRGQYHRKRLRYETYQQVRELIDNGKFDALIVATELHLPTMAPNLIPAIAGSRPVVFYSEFKEKLIELGHVLQKDYRVMAPTMLETRVRKYQTLPGRMHPSMTMRGGGGYVLWGTRVFPSQVNAVGVRDKKKRKKN
ncbi:hypothetical protein TRICI_003309 [Trichomonascus ciferrii]|uniref:tRNA (adenine(58)-N(1))-methyltransferase non-catalytic subunit TRM6 n=1 Tax=Trichomonascus ciferrii TaxID=44093 RepID=A0A642V3D4_9ASCO|nr:hypothetical protein TRICI_003309 [Trichomonascus ciferrii]